MPKRRASTAGGGVPAAVVALVPVDAASTTFGSPAESASRLDDLIYGALPDREFVFGAPYAPFSHEEWGRYETLYQQWQSGENDPSAGALSPAEIAELHEYLLRLVQYNIATFVYLRSIGSLRVFLNQGPEFSFSQYNSFRNLMQFERSFPRIAPSEPAVAELVLDAVRQRVRLIEEGNHRAAARDLRDLEALNEVSRVLDAGQPDLAETARSLSDRAFVAVMADATSMLESLRIGLMPFASGGLDDISVAEMQERIDKYREFAAAVRALAAEAERRGWETPEDMQRALRLHEEWMPRFEAELERQRRGL